jgi:hypothetical protein
VLPGRKEMIRKNTMIRVLTTNGGEIVASLLEDYTPSFRVVLARGNSYLIISADRIKRVEAA